MDTMRDSPHIFFSPHKIIFGPNTARYVGEEVKKLGGEKAFLVTDPGVVQAAPQSREAVFGISANSLCDV